MSSSSSVGKAFKLKAKHVRAILDLPLSLAQEYFSRILGYRDFDEAQRAGLVVRELASRAHLDERIREIVPGILPDKVEQLVKELNLPTGDRVMAQLREGGKLSADFSRYFSADGSFSEHYHQRLREVFPVFAKVHKISTVLGTPEQGECSIHQVVTNLANLSREDADTAMGFLGACYSEYSDFLPVNVAMLVLHGAGARRTTRLLAQKALAVFNGMLAGAAAVDIAPRSYSEVRSDLHFYGLAIAAVQRRLGAHDACLDLLEGLARLYPANAERFASLERAAIRREAAFAALFARRFHMVPELLQATSDGPLPHSYPTLAIEAIARAEMGEEGGATPLIDVLLCNPEIRLGLGLDDRGLIPRRRPEAMPLKSDVLDLTFGADLDRLRYLDLAAFRAAHALFLERDESMLGKMAASELVFKEFRVFPDLRFSEPRAKRRPSFHSGDSYSPALLRFGPAHGDAHVDVVVIRRSDIVGTRWLMPPQLAQVFKGNAIFDQDAARKRWLAHILSSGHVEKVDDAAGLGRKGGLGLWEKYRPPAALSRDEISFEIFRATERVERPYSRELEFGVVSDELALALIDAFRGALAEHLR